MKRTPLIRQAGAADAPRIAELLEELGYPSTADEVRERLACLGQLESAIVIVADLDGSAAGLATGHVFPALHASAPAAWVTALVVRSADRSAGLGRLLTAAVEDWARERGAVRISVTSGSHRDGAHTFYERLGYRRSGVRFTKDLV